MRAIERLPPRRFGAEVIGAEVIGAEPCGQAHRCQSVLSIPATFVNSVSTHIDKMVVGRVCSGPFAKSFGPLLWIFFINPYVRMKRKFHR